MDLTRILVLEDDDNRLIWFKGITMGFLHDLTDSAETAIKLLSENRYTQIFLDHDLGPHHYADYDPDRDDYNTPGKYDHETGFAVAKWLADNPDRSLGAEIIIHSLNAYAAKRMARELHRARRDYRVIPFHLLRITARTF